MRIALRTGGGRGVYELAGTHGGQPTSSLFGKNLSYEISPEILIDGRAVADVRQGKPRIKLDDQRKTTHLYRLVSALLLLPKPKREFKTTSGSILVAFESYSITAIKVEISRVEADDVVIRPTDLILENYSGLKQHVDIVSRMARISAIWKAAESSDLEIAELLARHRESVVGEEVDHKEVERTAKSIFSHLDTKLDLIERIEMLLGLATVEGFDEDDVTIIDEEFGIYDANSLKRARIENIRKWRKVAVRGVAAQKFRREVRAKYSGRCLFSGLKLPQLPSTASSGVDAAHILPWSKHGINQIPNGICLSKQSHWVFDAGVVKFSFDRTCNEYVISIPSEVRAESPEHEFDLVEFERIEGVVSRDRLPTDEVFWPSPDFLDEFNRVMFA